MIAAALVGVQDVVAQTQPVGAGLPAELKSMQRFQRARREQLDGISLALGLDELPHRLDLHEAGSLGLHLLHIVEQL